MLTDKDKYEAVKKYVDDQLTAGKMPAEIIQQIKQRYTIPTRNTNSFGIYDKNKKLTIMETNKIIKKRSGNAGIC